MQIGHITASGNFTLLHPVTKTLPQYYAEEMRAAYVRRDAKRIGYLSNKIALLNEAGRDAYRKHCEALWLIEA